MSESADFQHSLFEEDYLLRELGQVAHVPQVALTELVANAWDAGASKVDLKLPSEIGGKLIITDDGHGMSEAQFVKRWMTLRYDRAKHQGTDVEFPPGRKARKRKAYGRNGVGRHGLLCFGDEYVVESWRDGKLGIFVVGTESGPSPFVLRSSRIEPREGSGTRLSVIVHRHLPDPEEILTVLAARFLHDPEFQISVNGKARPFSEIGGKVSETEVALSDGRTAKVTVIDSTRVNHSALHQGIAFWVQRRLVGTPSWSVGNAATFDGRTRFARRYKVIVDTQGFEAGDVKEDWTGFKNTEPVREMFQKVAEEIRTVSRTLACEIIEESSEDALSSNRTELAILGRGAQREVAEFTKAIAQVHPTVSPEFLATAVNAVINLEKSKSGAALLQKLSSMPPDDIEGLDNLLNEWTIKDALRVLDEIDNRLRVIETIKRIAGDSNTDELHTLHPLILRSRWLFGPEFESEEYSSNATLQTMARELFGSKGEFDNPAKRPDVVLLPDKTTVQLTGIESFDPSDSTIVRLQNILLIELKKGGFEITRKEVEQADGYVQDIAGSGAINGLPYICAWVVGEKIKAKVAREKRVFTEDSREFGRIRATTFGALVDTANLRLMKLRDRLADRYGEMPTDHLLERVLSTPKQEILPLVAVGGQK